MKSQTERFSLNRVAFSLLTVLVLVSCTNDPFGPQHASGDSGGCVPTLTRVGSVQSRIDEAASDRQQPMARKASDAKVPDDSELRPCD